MRHFLLPLFILLFLAGCKSKQTLKEKQQELETGKLNEKNNYNATEVGWSVQLPENWEVLTKQAVDGLNEKGKDLIENSSNTKIDLAGLVYLINLKKDPFNAFNSTIEPFDEKKDGSYEERNVAVVEVMKNAYESKNIHTVWERGTESINGLSFDVASGKIYSPDKTKVILSQKMYSRLINGYDFSMTMSYNNEKDLQTLLDMVTSSKFSIRE